MNDDASSAQDAIVLREEIGSAKLIRQERNVGYIEARNILMRASTADYLVHLDDDAGWPRDDAIEQAIRVMEAHPNCGIFAFKVHEAIESPVDPSPPHNVHPVRSYTGCGHIIARWAFDKLGPLRSDYFFYCEEIEYCLRGLDAGIQTLTDDGLIVHHRVDWLARDRLRAKDQGEGAGERGKDWRVRMAARNEMWWVSELVPWPVLPFYLLYKVCSLLRFHTPRGFGRNVLEGVVEWVVLLRRGKIHRRPVSLRTFRAWLTLPA